MSFMVPLTHAAVCLDHHNADVLQLDATQTFDQQIGHAFISLATTSARRAATRVLRRDCRGEKYRPDVSGQIVGWQAEVHPTEHEVVRLTREHFDKDTGAAPRFA